MNNAAGPNSPDLGWRLNGVSHTHTTAVCVGMARMLLFQTTPTSLWGQVLRLQIWTLHHPTCALSPLNFSYMLYQTQFFDVHGNCGVMRDPCLVTCLTMQ
jgi:hypothetical protein